LGAHNVSRSDGGSDIVPYSNVANFGSLDRSDIVPNSHFLHITTHNRGDSVAYVIHARAQRRIGEPAYTYIMDGCPIDGGDVVAHSLKCHGVSHHSRELFYSRPSV